MDCLYCGGAIERLTADELPTGVRVAYDSRSGRLWQVCPSCERWNAVPLEDRWEILELCERESDGAEMLVQTDQLSLLAAGRARLIRVGRPPRADFAVWRYSELLDRFFRRRTGLSRLLRLPDRPVGGAIGADYHGGVVTVPDAWIGSPFIAHGSLLTLLFSSVPLARGCPSCGQPLIIEPSSFSEVRIVSAGGDLRVATVCALCGVAVDVPQRAARAALRTGLAIVSREHRQVERVRSAAAPLDRHGTPRRFIGELARKEHSIGSLSPRLRLSLRLALDEWAEADALEAEWRRAEELAAISDGELTEVPGFVEFKERVLGEDDND